MFRYRQRPCRRLLLLFGRGVILIALTNVLRRACAANFSSANLCSPASSWNWARQKPEIYSQAAICSRGNSVLFLGILHATFSF